MKLSHLYSFISLISSFIGSGYAQEAPPTLPHIILHYDVNRAILADDPAGGKSIQDAILHSIADSHKDRWSPAVQEPISYGDYVKEHLCPETEATKQDKAAKAALKKARNEKVSEFITYLKESRHPKYAQAQDEFMRMNARLTSSKSIVFESFYACVNYLHAKGFPHTIILRTFGDDLPRVTQDINDTLRMNFFTMNGKFTDKKLNINGKWLTTPAEQYAFFKSAGRHCAIQDNWREWDSSGELQEYSKQFPLNPNEKDTITIFFDDNINPNPGSKKNIVNPLNVTTGRSLSVPDLIENGSIVVVDTVRAVLDTDYFVKAVEKRLKTQ